MSTADPFAGLPYAYFGAILTDVPLRFETWSDKGKGRSADWHYVTMRLDELRAHDVASLAARDCALFHWATWPTLPQHLELIAGWGFTFKTCAFLWVKADVSQIDMFRDDADVQIGNGYWTRANTEPCLLATRGKPKRLNADVLQAIIEPRREHSRKPDQVHARIERLVAGPYLELFARRHRPGWSCWGNELPLDSYNPNDDINKSVAEGFSVIRERVNAAGGWAEQERQGFPDLPDFLRRAATGGT